MAVEHVVLDALNTERETPGDRLARWVRDHAAAVRGYLLGLVRRADLADDLLQEVFQRAWQARDRYEDRGTERALMMTNTQAWVVTRIR